MTNKLETQEELTQKKEDQNQKALIDENKEEKEKEKKIEEEKEKKNKNKKKKVLYNNKTKKSKEGQPILLDLSHDDVPLKIESLCVNCEKNGETRLLLTKIPHFREIIIASFDCPHCDFKNNEIQFAGTFAEKGCKITLEVSDKKDMDRQIIKSEYATFTIPEIEFEMTAEVRKGQLNTVEGFLTNALNSLEYTNKEQEMLGNEIPKKLETFLEKLQKLIKLEEKFHIVLNDYSGNSYVENLLAPKEDPKLEHEFYERTKKMNIAIGVSIPELDEEKQNQKKKEQNMEDRKKEKETQETEGIEKKEKNNQQSQKKNKKTRKPNSMLEIPFKGLTNLGNTCYLNSSIQALLCCSAFRSYFIYCGYDYESSTKIPNCLTEFSDLVLQIDQKTNSNNEISIEDFLSEIGIQFPIYNTYDQQDASEFLILFLDYLHEILKKKKTRVNHPQILPNLLNTNPNPNTQNLNKKQKQPDKEVSVVSSLFYGKIKNKFQCLYCGSKSYSNEEFVLLPLSMPTKSTQLTKSKFNKSNTKLQSKTEKQTQTGTGTKAQTQTQTETEIETETETERGREKEKEKEKEKKNKNKNKNTNKNTKQERKEYYKIQNKFQNTKNFLKNLSIVKYFLALIVTFFNYLRNYFNTIVYNLKVILFSILASVTGFGSNLVRKFIKRSIFEFFLGDNMITKSLFPKPILLKDCLNLFFSDNILKEENKKSCKNCRRKTKTKKNSELKKLPEYLILHLKKFNYSNNISKKIFRRVIFPIELDLNDYLISNGNKHKNGESNNKMDVREEEEVGVGVEVEVEVEKNEEINPNKKVKNEKELINSKYTLIAIIEHLGTTINSGHYIAYCKNHLNEWYELNDSRIKKITEEEALTKEAYILFYQKDIPKSIFNLQQQLKTRFMDNINEVNRAKVGEPMYVLERLWFHMSLLISNPSKFPSRSLICEHNNLTHKNQNWFKITPTFHDFLNQNFKNQHTIKNQEICSKCPELEHQLSYIRKEHRRLIKNIPNLKKEKIQYMIEGNWIHNWKQFLQGGFRPEKINNYLLLEKDKKSIRKELIIDKDYYLVPSIIWKSVKKAFGANPTIRIRTKN
ncbi:ubiquitin carboxyl-terminal hydrolase [Anaeramoeba flamelloides]|uniref:Ubiquitin carboxyl-terminal hydrolase n=1 Tax=Anaeramoeba flamelloides TaxID=1746091 RepID=A0ABQ8Y4I1_9EUKA|nr:ubiquitin carboxyl-terminal hydrolase [Anaeramoeba flamelloides]